MKITECLETGERCPHLKTLAKFINEHLDGVEAKVYGKSNVFGEPPGRHFAGDRIIIKRLYDGEILLDHSTVGTKFRNQRVVEWIQLYLDRQNHGKA